MTLVNKVRLEGIGTQGLSLVTPVCDICGAVLADQKLHDEWHEQVDRQLTDPPETIADDL